MDRVDKAIHIFFSTDEDKLSDLIAARAEKFVDSLHNADLRAIAWELLDKNVWWMRRVKTWADPVEGIPWGMIEIIHNGFTYSQMKRLKRLDSALRGGE